MKWLKQKKKPNPPTQILLRKTKAVNQATTEVEQGVQFGQNPSAAKTKLANRSVKALSTPQLTLAKRQKPTTATTTHTTQTSTPRRALAKIGGKSKMPWLYVLPLLLVIPALWYWLNRAPQAPTEPVSTAPAPVAAPKASAPATSTASAVAMAQAAREAATADASTQMAEHVPEVANAIHLITPEDILAPAMPQDPALAKEELDRLDEQSSQLAEQQAMMSEQLDMMNELSNKKAERIRLLEQRIAELEREQEASKSSP